MKKFDFFLGSIIILTCVSITSCSDDEGGASGPVDWDASAFRDADEMTANGGDQNYESDFAGKYRDDLANHIGCEPRDSYDGTDGPFSQINDAVVAAGTPLVLEGYNCAAKDYTHTAGGDPLVEDENKPIVILVHGNSESPNVWEEFSDSGMSENSYNTMSDYSFVPDSTARTMLASRLIEAGYRTIAVDARVDLVLNLADFITTGDYANASSNIDHGWYVPILQSLVKAVMKNYPDRKVSLIGHSLGVTAARDAIRRLFVEYLDNIDGAVNPWPRLKDVIMLHGANHGVSTYGALCGANLSMKGTVTCEMGSRDAYTQTYFHAPINGYLDEWTTPCGDGETAFSQRGHCGGNSAQYTTITIADDRSNGNLRDEFVSQESAKLNSDYCQNLTVTADDHDTSGYFFPPYYGYFSNHYSSARSEAGMSKILEILGD